MSREVNPKDIPGLLFIEMNFFKDERGFFARNFCTKTISKFNGFPNVAQANLSFNAEPGTIRGFHFQGNGYEEAKTITVIEGSLHYKVVDLRPNSPTYLKYTSFELQKLSTVVQVPKGCAPGFQTLEPNTLLHYYVSTEYSPDNESGIRYNDPFFEMNWPLEISVVSNRDSEFEDFDPKVFKGLASV